MTSGGRVTATLVAGCRPRHVYRASLLLLLLCLGVLLINVHQLRLMQADHAALHHLPRQPPPAPAAPAHPHRVSRPVVWVYGKKLDTGYLQHVYSVFERLGYETDGDGLSDWTVLWSHVHPFTVLSRHTSNLKPHQKVNHFPGSGALTNKASLVKLDIPLIPKAFRIPSELQDLQLYAKRHPEKLWVQKGSAHRGIRISSINDLKKDVKPVGSSSELIVQEYVDRPLLIDGRRFDIGLYVTLTSVDPLRVYVFQGEWLIRFCSKAYEPFNSSDVNQYVISDDYTPMWEMPSFKKYYNELDSNRKEAFFVYFRSQGNNPEKLNNELEDAIRRICYLKEQAIINAMSAYRPRNFFEMVRFDFVVNEDLRIFLMEVNMSPNLSSGHFAKNKLLYEQVIYNTLTLVGLATSLSAAEARSMSPDTREMQVSSRDIRVHLETCSSSCAVSCHAPMCRLCRRCIGTDDESVLRSAFLEHLRRRMWRRVIPRPFQSKNNAQRWNVSDDSEFAALHASNQLMTLWFHGKCLQDESWCL